jgi:hypothetical protein
MGKPRKRAGRIAPAAAAAAAADPRKRVGRPAVAAADRRETIVRVLTTDAEHGELQRAAASVAMSVSTWVRVIALESARTLAAEKMKQDRDKK